LNAANDKQAALWEGEMGKTKIVAAILAALALGACVTTQELPLAPNMVRLDTHAKGLIFAGHAADFTMQRAAQVTIKNGFDYFRLDQAQMSQGSQLAGIYSTSTGSAFATSYGSFTTVNGSGSGFSTPIMAPTADVGVTVIMFHAGEPGAKGAFDARAVLAKYGS
jgi:hypothetical protein